MFFENDDFSVGIFSVERYTWTAAERTVRQRPFGALVFRIAGEGDFTFENGERVYSRAGDVMYVPSGIGYSVRHTDGEVLAIHFRERNSGRRAENYPQRAACTESLFFDAKRLFSLQTLSSQMELISVFYKILSFLGETAKTDERGENETFLRAVAILSEEFGDAEVGISEICARAQISESSFRKLFLKRYAKPPVRFLCELRLRKAQEMLARGEGRVEDVAHACGFRDVKYFYRVFKRHFGTTPSELRSV